jgi:hypothetical protein
MGDNGSNGASQEAILPLLQDGVKTTAWCSTLFLMASTWKADMDVDADYGTSEFWAGNRARSQLVAKFFPNGDAPQLNIKETAIAAGDDRALFFGIGHNLVVTLPTDYTSGYAVGKYRNTYAAGGSPHNSQFIDTDYFLMRSAEAYLIAAEADARINGGSTTATVPAISTPCASVPTPPRAAATPSTKSSTSAHANSTTKASAAQTLSATAISAATRAATISGTGRAALQTVPHSPSTSTSSHYPQRTSMPTPT